MKKGDKIAAVAEKCCLILGLTDPPENIQDELKLLSKFYCLKIKSRWDKSARKQSTFLTNKAWLGKQISLPDSVKSFNSNICSPEPGPSGKQIDRIGEKLQFKYLFS
ncbi:hypothetical protein QE152_g5602 [Popillia japonica]|uniref:Uncharacterized protein n=1 Tax=Popillia japonica TaxID=7064 RepID=A0AAW1MHP4_POPJA